ncbi:carbohydrate ABC transporter permease [Frondihabitans sp. VKM Ac-2883]|uniref:carbohydrate ABC transporter permease n=1 Tax=Frondihabitans sp. VKM Ac-2883 TaxID=2783823 RepID=UPI00188BFEDB|nr:sugar ABC transporter permease [Frondihabitans sp. VKM Ac-2883]MBF4575998.1 sugar ABC transporter permease [Frondihabitans sp. VKM Ac-2883]
MTLNVLPPASTESGLPEEPQRSESAPLRPARKKKRPSLLPYGLIAPAALAELLIHLLPMVLGIWIAFITLNQLSIANWVDAPFVGFQNFVNGLNPNSSIGAEFYSALGRTIGFTIIVLAIAWSMGMLGAVLLTTSFRGRGILRTLFLVPYALPSYVGTIAWAFMFNRSDGAINHFLVDQLHLFGGGRPFWLLGGNSFWAIVIVTAWQMWPFAFLMLLAALQNIPGDVYEAAALDGASLWKQFTRITLPMIKPANAVLMLIMGLWIFNQFNVPFVLFGAASPKEATLISPLIYQQSFSNWNFGLGGAMSVLLLIVLLIASAFYIRMVLPKPKPGEED